MSDVLDSMGWGNFPKGDGKFTIKYDINCRVFVDVYSFVESYF